jgi:GNAT superfamily N-acetyltransferase
MGRVEKKWELMVCDAPDNEAATALSQFIGSFLDADRDRVRQDADHYLWKITRNPNGNGFISLAVNGSEIVGSTTITCKKVWLKGQWVRAGEIGDTFTDPNYQRQGIFTSLVKATRDRAIESGVRLIYGTPNSQSLPGYEKKCQFKRKDGLNLFLWLLPIKPVSSLGSAHRRSGGAVLKRTINSAAVATIRTLAGNGKDVTDLAKPNFNLAFDELGTKLRTRFDFMLCRDLEQLTFRLATNPERERYGVVSRKVNDQLSATLFYKTTAQQRMKVLFIADFYGESFSAVRSVWKRAVQLAATEGYDLVATWAPLRFSLLAEMLPLPAIPVRRLEVIIDDHDLGSKALLDRGPWRFSVLDSDNI